MPKPDFHSNFKYFFKIIWAPYYWFSTKILILKNIFYFLKSVKGGYLSYLLLIQHKNLNFKHIFYFLKSVKWGPWQKFFTTPANFNRPLYQSQAFIWTLNIFPYYLSYLLLIQHKNLILKNIFYFLKSVKGGYLSYLLLIQHKNFNFKHIFYFLKSVKGGPLTKTFQLLQTLTSHCAKARFLFKI